MDTYDNTIIESLSTANFFMKEKILEQADEIKRLNDLIQRLQNQRVIGVSKGVQKKENEK